MSNVRRADVCAAAIADYFKGDGEIFCSPMGTLPTLGARLAKATFEPELLLTDGMNKIVKDVLPLGQKPGAKNIEGYMPFEFVFDTLWWGKRHVMMGATQIDQFGNQNISCIGDWKKPTVQLLGVRGAPGNTVNHTTSYWVPNHGPKVFVDKVDVVSGVGYDKVNRTLPKGFHEIRRVVSNLCVMDFDGPEHRMRLRSVHPGVNVGDVVSQTGFELVIDGDVPTTRMPTGAELEIIRTLDPNDYASKEVQS
ncbi:MAG: hypothetical protein R3A47_06865 [Polyangiales bacterium]